jgi:hypothetical protein
LRRNRNKHPKLLPFFNFDTMIYTHTIKSKTIKEAKSSLGF